MQTIERLLAQREDAALRGDGNLVREITLYLDRIGYAPEPVAKMERATPKRTRRKS